MIFKEAGALAFDSNGLIRPISNIYEGYLCDESHVAGAAESISFPRSEAELAMVIGSDGLRGRPITVQGGRTGISAAAVPQGGHIINMSRMDRVTGMRTDSAGKFYLRLQPGITLSQLNACISQKSFDISGWDAGSQAAYAAFRQSPVQFFAPDPTEASATLGGMAACNASGSLSYRYGSVRGHISALRVMLIDGRVLDVQRGANFAAGRLLRLKAGDGGCIPLPLPGYSMPLAKNAAGYYVDDDMDAIDLFIGSGGTLGLICSMEIALLRRPAHVCDSMCFFSDGPGRSAEEKALLFVSLLRSCAGSPAAADTGASPASPASAATTASPASPASAGALAAGTSSASAGRSTTAAATISGRSTAAAATTANLAAIEYFDARSLEILRLKAAAGALPDMPAIPERYGAAVCLELHSGNPDDEAGLLIAACGCMEDAGGDADDTWIAREASAKAKLRMLRHAIPESVNEMIGQRRQASPAISKIASDIAVPDGQLERMVGIYRASIAASGLDCAVWGHIGDNHLHVNILPHDMGEFAKGKQLLAEWAHEACAMGGTVSAEHGIGKLKTEYLAIMYGEAHVGEMAALKLALDPECRLSPGVMFAAPTAAPAASPSVAPTR
ncbi:MAG: FAD-binding oxidoreductase [Clostridiales Family XIII bacterium]|jgi:D-lactate dehydrogenase (cytochrome)|nr:FAD-binding oxidoreductase [Clostridiales Family XIII bacterium]